MEAQRKGLLFVGVVCSSNFGSFRAQAVPNCVLCSLPFFRFACLGIRTIKLLSPVCAEQHGVNINFENGY